MLLAADIARLEELPHPQDKYDEFTAGKWTNMPLLNVSGKRDDGVFRDADSAPKPTSLLDEVPHIADVVNRCFSQERLFMARLRNVVDWSIIPHRDFLELADPSDNYYRVLITLQDNPYCVNSEEDMVFRMEKGQVWFLDAANMHSAVNPSTLSRWTLCLDFKTGSDFSPEDIFADGSLYDPTIEPTLLERQPISSRLDPGLVRHFASLITPHNLKDIAFALGKVHFTKDITVGQSWDWMIDIAKASGHDEVIDRVEGAVEFFTGARKMNERFSFTVA
ncbi:aspartyl/asparaginyl beta-hydroxylase domain-containing protein [Streptomyces sp. NPDC054956]